MYYEELQVVAAELPSTIGALLIPLFGQFLEEFFSETELPTLWVLGNSGVCFGCLGEVVLRGHCSGRPRRLRWWLHPPVGVVHRGIDEVPPGGKVLAHRTRRQWPTLRLVAAPVGDQLCGHRKPGPHLHPVHGESGHRSLPGHRALGAASVYDPIHVVAVLDHAESRELQARGVGGRCDEHL